jgi:hypothetical protein
MVIFRQCQEGCCFRVYMTAASVHSPVVPVPAFDVLAVPCSSHQNLISTTAFRNKTIPSPGLVLYESAPEKNKKRHCKGYLVMPLGRDPDGFNMFSIKASTCLPSRGSVVQNL